MRMLILVLGQPSTSPSAGALAREINNLPETLARATVARRLHLRTSDFPNLRQVLGIVNYGVGHIDNGSTLRRFLEAAADERIPVINTRLAVRNSANKISTTGLLRDRQLPFLDTCFNQRTALNWIMNGVTVVARTTIQGHSGNGIVLCPPDNLPQAHMYTRLFTGPRIREYRVYVVGGRAVDLAEKRRWNRDRLIAAGIDPDDAIRATIRTNGNGWVFARQMSASRLCQEDIKELAVNAAQATSLDMGGIDIIVNYANDEHTIIDDMRVIETNSAIGITSDTRTRHTMASEVVHKLRTEWELPVEQRTLRSRI